MGVNPDEIFITEVDEEILHSHYERVTPAPRKRDYAAMQGDIIRESISLSMCQNYVQM